MNRKYDLIVVGAGPAGLTAAKVAAENGLKTALLERKTDMTRVCRVDGGNLSPINEYVFGQICTFNPTIKRIAFPVSGFSIPYDGPYRNVYGFNLFSPTGRRITFGDRKKQKQDPEKYRVGISLDKEILLQGLLNEARAAGAQIFSGTNVTGIVKKKSFVELTGNGEAFAADFIIAADGVNSLLARLMGMNKDRTFYATYLDCSWTFEGLDIPQADEDLTFVLTAYGTFSVLSCAQKGRFEVGVSSFNPLKSDLLEKLTTFVYKDAVYSRWFQGGTKTREHACICTELSPIKEPFKDNVLFIGDAAWLQEISNAAAVCCGWKAANAVTLALMNSKLDKDGIACYLEWWQKYFYGPCGNLEFKPITIQDFLSADDLDYLAGLIQAPLSPTLNFYKFFSTIGETYGELFPVIAEQRPDVMEKMMGLVNSMEETEKEVRRVGFPNR